MNGLHFINGNNFSGRTTILKSYLDLKAIYIGEEASNRMSGMMSIATEEMLLHLQNKNPSVIEKFIEVFDFKNLIDTNPFSLSGGEKTILCLFIHLLLDKEKILIDNTLEQLNEDWRNKFMLLFKKEFPQKELYIADNRFEEYNWEASVINSDKQSRENYPIVFDKPNFSASISFTKEQKLNVLEVNNLSFSYDRKRIIFNNVTIRFESGIYHLKGLNGAGKSTLSKIILGIEKPSKGQILFNEKIINPFRYPGNYCSYASQDPSDQIFHQRVESEIIGHSKPNEQKMLWLLDCFGLKSVRDSHPEDLPFSMRKRIVIASAFYDDKEIIILDEASLAQDNEFIEGFADLLNKMGKLGKIIIVISHSNYFISLLDNVKQVELQKSLA